MATACGDSTARSSSASHNRVRSPWVRPRACRSAARCREQTRAGRAGQPNVAERGAGAGLRGVAGQFFDALSGHVTAGRAFTDTDTATSPARQAMVDEEFARNVTGPARTPSAKRLEAGRCRLRSIPGKSWWAVYADLEHQGPHAETRPEVMFPVRAERTAIGSHVSCVGLSVVIRTTGDAMSLMPAAVWCRPFRSIRTVPLVEPRRMTTLVSDSMAQPRFRERACSSSFACLAVLLAVVGIYGMVGFNIGQRTSVKSVCARHWAPQRCIGRRTGSCVRS